MVTVRDPATNNTVRVGIRIPDARPERPVPYSLTLKNRFGGLLFHLSRRDLER
jgi:hypothetical protein